MKDSRLTWEQAVLQLREQPDKKELVRQCYYDDPLEKAACRFNNSEEWKAVSKLLKNKIPCSVLDIGAGRGISSFAFANHGCNVTALEPDPSSFIGCRAIQELSHHAYTPIQIVRDIVEELPFKDNTFDIVYGRAVFHHAKNINHFCRESARVLKKGGCFLMTREHVISHTSDLPIFLKSHPLHYLYGGEYAYTLKAYLQAIQKSGLKQPVYFGPFSTVINYAPLTIRGHEQQLISILSPRVGHTLAEKLVEFKWMRKTISKCLEYLIHTPGRLYTFMASKPE